LTLKGDGHLHCELKHALARDQLEFGVSLWYYFENYWDNDIGRRGSVKMKILVTGFNTLVAMILLALTALGPVCSYNWLQFGGNAQHTGSNLKETIITGANVSQLKQLFQVTLGASIDGPVAYLSSVTTPSGTKDVVYGTTWVGGIVALDAHTGAQVWAKQAFTDPCKILGTTFDCIVHSAVAIDPNLKYIYSYSLDGKVHKYQVGDGTEIVEGNWPELITLKPDLEKQSASLVFATAQDGHTYLYVPIASYPGDWGEYQGHIVTINLDNGAQKVFNMVCSDQTVHFTYAPGPPDCAEIQASVWGRASVVYQPALDKIFMTTANGPFNPVKHDWGTSVIALNPDGSGANGDPLDTYTPDTYPQLNNFDIDMGSTAPVILPVPANSVVRFLGLQSGKDGKLRLLNLANLSGQGGPGHIDGEIGAILDVPIGNAAANDFEVRTAPVVWTNPADRSIWVFISNDFGICAFKLIFDSGGVPSLAFQWKNVSYTLSTSPLMANSVLYLASSVDATHGLIRALNPLTGDTLWSDDTIGTIHWSVPVVDNGVLYISDENNHLTAYAIAGAAPQTISCSYNWLTMIFK
jgi:outer membrane protein assembly factor BamB